MFHWLPIIVQELCVSRGGRPGLSVLTSLLVSVDIKLYWTMLRHWSQLVPNNYVNWHMTTLFNTTCLPTAYLGFIQYYIFHPSWLFRGRCLNDCLSVSSPPPPPLSQYISPLFPFNRFGQKFAWLPILVCFFPHQYNLPQQHSIYVNVHHGLK